MDLSHVERVAPLLAQGLSMEEVSGLEMGMLQRRLQENLAGKLMFWGKIYGTTQDYLIVFHISPLDDFPVRKFYFCTTGDYTLRAMPHLKPEYIVQADGIQTAFLGDPSFFAYNGEEEEEEEEEEDAPPRERFCEMHRLAHVVNKIDHACAVVPRGAIAIDATKRVVNNSNYQGLSAATAGSLRAYQHMRMPENLPGQALLKRPGVATADDFLDSLEGDRPSEVWTLSFDSLHSVAHLRNVYWEGYGFYAVLGSPEYGGVYFGNGVPNHDFALGF